MGRNIIHVGMPRAASTFFQRELFPYVEGFRYIGVNETQYSDHFQNLLYQDESLYDRTSTATAISPKEEENLLISNELFVGQSLFLNGTNRTRNAERLSAIFPNAEILLVLRNQADILQSLYSIGVYSGNAMKPEDFIRFSDEPSSLKNPRYHTFSPAESTEIYHYTELIKLYRRLFSKVHVVFYEDFEATPRDFISRLLSDLGLILNREIRFSDKINRSLSARQLYFFKFLNRWAPLINRGKFGSGLFRMKQQFIEKQLSGGKAFVFDSALREKIKRTFRSNNALLAEEIPEMKGKENFERHYWL